MGLAPQLITSTGTQWHQTTHGILPLGNWDGRNEGVLLLDDGRVFGNVNRKQHMFQDQEGIAQWFGELSPEGCVQWSGDLWAYDTSKDGPFGASGYVDEDYIWRLMIQNEDNADHLWLTDGKFIYYSVPGIDSIQGSPSNDGARIYRFDPNSGLTKWIAGGPPGGGENSGIGTTGDSHDGRQAKLPSTFYACTDREFIYWLQRVDNTDNDPAGELYEPSAIIRRMKLEDPYPVDTLPGVVLNPSWYTGPTSEEDFNPSTGLPYKYEPDFLSVDNPALGVDEDYLYVMNRDLRRLPKAGGNVETFIWQTGRDAFSDYAATPNGPETGLWRGRPELEGLSNQFGGLKLMGRRLFFINISGGTFFQFYNLMGHRFAYFDLNELENIYNRSGPQRVNRASPQWTTIMNGTHYYEQYPNRYTNQSWFINGGYSWGWRDGSTPLVQNPYRYFDINPEASGWENRLVFMHAEICRTVGSASGYGSDNRVTHVAAYLEEEANVQSQFSLSFQFTGDLLKSYAAAREVKPPQAPKEVQLG